jgi:hypothetical protein
MAKTKSKQQAPAAEGRDTEMARQYATIATANSEAFARLCGCESCEAYLGGEG